MTYSAEFYADQDPGAFESALVVLPLVGERLTVSSVVDFGQGSGAWLRACRELFGAETFGIDSTGVDPDASFDLSRPVELTKVYDLALCLEVAEHLDATAADVLIDSLVASAPTVLFSAAIPGQPGVNHVNCQWQSHWVEKFEARGYAVSGDLRWAIWGDGRVENFYRQNLFLASREIELVNVGPLDVCHPDRVTPGWVGR